MSTTFSSWLHSQASDSFTRYRQHECQALELYSFEGLSTPTKKLVIPAAHLDDWLFERGTYSIPNAATDNTFLGGLRIILQQWEDDDFSQNTLVPFKDDITFKKVLTVLRLPPEYPYQSTYSTYIPATIFTQKDHTSNAAITKIMFQSPRFKESYMTMALSYDSSTKITTGFLGYMKVGNESLLPSVLNSTADAYHPLMLPILCFHNSIENLRHETRWQSRERAAIGKNIQRAAEISHLNSVDFPDIHQRLIDSHLKLSNASVPFVEASCHRLIAALGNTKLIVSPDQILSAALEAKTQELTRCLELLDYLSTDMITHRKGLVLRMDLHLKTLYTLMQSRDSAINRDLAHQSTQMAIQSKSIAEATQKDGSAMKAIAIVTMVFLPGTAISTMFSMSVFFGVNESGTVTVSPSIWVFWAVTIPLTFAVLSSWVAWLYRDGLKKAWLKSVWSKATWVLARGSHEAFEMN